MSCATAFSDIPKKYCHSKMTIVSLSTISSVKVLYHNSLSSNVLVGTFKLDKGEHSIKLPKNGFYSIKIKSLLEER